MMGKRRVGAQEGFSAERARQGHGELSKRDARRLCGPDKGQATVELAVVLPVVIMLAVLVVNALTFFGTCASFDRAVRQAVCVQAAAPSADQVLEGVTARMEQAAREAVPEANVSVSVSVQARAPGLTKFTARLTYRPTLFGVGFRDSIFGLRLPELSHDTSLVVDPYRPGVLF